MSRQPSALVAQRNDALVQGIRELQAARPFWGYRRSWAYRRFVAHQPMHKKRILRLMRAHQLLVTPNLRLRAKRTPTGRKPKPTKPNAWWGLDMTKVLVAGVGWLDIAVVLAWYRQLIVGHDAGMQWKAQPWLVALEMAVNRHLPDGARGKGLSLMRDNGGQPTGDQSESAMIRHVP
jgi:putative transposase